MAAAKIVLEPIFEADFLPTSYGFRPGLSAHHALETVRQTATWRGKGWVLDADIQSCFDEIDSRRPALPDRAAGVRSADAQAAAGVAAGRGVRGRDRVRDRSGHPARVADLTAARQHRPARARSGVGGWRAAAGDAGQYCGRLRGPMRHPRPGRAGPRVGGGGPGRARVAVAPGEDQDRAPRKRRRRASTSSASSIGCVESWKQRGRTGICTSGRRRRAMASIRAKIRDLTAPPLRRGCRWNTRSRTSTTSFVVGATTSATGTPRRKFAQIDGYVHERLAILASAKHGLLRAATGSDRFNYEWLGHLGVYRLNGTVRPDACACQPVNDVGEPCAGEPHARFDAAAGGNPGPVGPSRAVRGRLPPTLRRTSAMPLRRSEGLHRQRSPAFAAPEDHELACASRDKRHGLASCAECPGHAIAQMKGVALVRGDATPCPGRAYAVRGAFLSGAGRTTILRLSGGTTTVLP